MSREKSKSKPPKTQSEDKPEQNSSEIIKHLPAIIAAIATLLTALAGFLVALNQAGLISFSPSPTPAPSFTPTPTWTATLTPVNTIAPGESPSPTATMTLMPTATETLTPIPSTGANCPWIPFSTLNPGLTIGKDCLNDLLSLGISQTGGNIFFYRESGMNIGVFGISRKVQTGDEFNITVSIKTLKAVRFLVLLSQKEQGYASSVGFRILREGNTKLIQLLRYDSGGYNTVISDIDELDLWGGKLKLTLKFRGPQVRAYVNDTYFGQTQIEFLERNLFLGYQVMSGRESGPRIDVSVAWP